jgi:drug/metabolite transporter (DMT)-like permease
MGFTLIPFFLYRYGKAGVTNIDKSVALNMLIPTVLEFIGQTLFLFGIQQIPMSLSMTLKGSRVVFSAVLLVIFLKRRLFVFHWVAVSLTILGLIIASLPSIISPKDKSKTVSQSLIGITLVLAGELVRSFKGVFEERLMKKLHYDALMVVGLQGLLAFILSLPILGIVHAINIDGKPLEDINDTWSQFGSNGLVIGLSLTFPITVSGLFLSGAYVVKLMSAVHNALTGIITTSLVWIVTIVIHLIDKNRGAAVDVLDLLQLTGFALVFVASLMYDSIFRLPIFYYPTDRAAASGAGNSVPNVSKDDADVLVDQDIAETVKMVHLENQVSDSDEEQVTIIPDDSTETSPTRRRN